MNHTLSALNSLHHQGASPVLSVYLGAEGKKTPSTTALRSRLHSLVHTELTDHTRTLFRDDIARMDTFLREHCDTRNTRGIAFFSSGKDLWKAIRLPFPVPSSCTVATRPNLKLLQRATKQHPPYVVLLVDREKARMFTVHLGNISEHLDVFDRHVPQMVKAIKADFNREDIIFRHIGVHLHEHLALVAEVVKGFVRGKTFRFILLGGHRELLPVIRHHLPASLQRKIRGTFDSELNIPLNDIRLLSEQVVEKLEKHPPLVSTTA